MTSLPLQPTISLGTQLTEQVVTFSAQDKKLAGHLIHAQQTEPAILFLHGWAGLRTGPHGLLTHLARNAGQSGFSSLRFDFYGRGDSGHSRSEASLDQMGMDARHALDYVLEATGATKAIVVGICSGGNVGLGALTGDPRVVGFFLMSVYPFGDGDSFGRDLNRTAHHAKGYWQKLWQRQTWKRFLRGDVSLKGVAKTLTGHWMKEPASGQKVTFPNFFDGLRKCRPVVSMVYGGADPDTRASLDYFKGFDQTYDLGVHFEVLDEADHNFSSCESVAILTERLLSLAEQLRRKSQL